jgi:Ran GTPase-activating protein (RanGAP) involved in mRNA processing and transport
MDSARCLSRSLLSHSCINYLRLGYCDLGNSPEILLVILQSDVSNMDLSNNNIESLGAAKIAEYLEGDPPIRMINLGHNRLNDNDVILISQALKRNTNLKTLHIHTNDLTSSGV